MIRVTLPESAIGRPDNGGEARPRPPLSSVDAQLMSGRRLLAPRRPALPLVPVALDLTVKACFRTSGKNKPQYLRGFQLRLSDGPRHYVRQGLATKTRTNCLFEPFGYGSGGVWHLRYIKAQPTGLTGPRTRYLWKVHPHETAWERQLLRLNRGVSIAVRYNSHCRLVPQSANPYLWRISRSG